MVTVHLRLIQVIRNVLISFSNTNIYRGNVKSKKKRKVKAVENDDFLDWILAIDATKCWNRVK